MLALIDYCPDIKSVLSFQIYGEETEYAEDIFSSGDRVTTRRSSKKAKKTDFGDSCSTSPERNRKDDVVS